MNCILFKKQSLFQQNLSYLYIPLVVNIDTTYNIMNTKNDPFAISDAPPIISPYPKIAETIAVII